MSFDIVLACAHCDARNRVLVERLGETAICGECKQALLEPGQPLELDDTSFPAVIAGSMRPVLVDFWASWCGPCRSFAPVLERFASEQGAGVLVAKVNVDAARRVAAQHQIRSIPTLALFAGGKEAARHVGGLSATELTEFVRAAS